MPRIRTLVVVLAGGAGGRLELLTQERAKPAVSFAGTHRLIDFALSNAANAGVTDVWVSQQFNPISLEDHLANGRPWDLDRTLGGLLLLHPRQGYDERTGFQRGTADGLWRFAPLIREFGPAALVVVSADAAYAHDYGALVEEHVAHDADVTLVIFVFTPGAVLDTLEELAGDAGEEGLEDLVPRLAAEGRVREHRFGGYWRDVGTVAAYWQAHSDLLAEVPPLDLDDPDSGGAGDPRRPGRGRPRRADRGGERRHRPRGPARRRGARGRAARRRALPRGGGMREPSSSSIRGAARAPGRG